MRMNRGHLIYLLAFVPGLLGLMLQILLGAYFHVAMRVIVLLLLTFILIQMTKHFLHLPKPKKLYGELTELPEIRLPEALIKDEKVVIYTSNTIDLLYEDHATADVITSLFEKEELRKVVISPKILEEKPGLAEIIAARAYVEDKTHGRARNFLFMLLPFLLLMNFLLAYYFGDLSFLEQYRGLIRNILMPAVVALSVIAIMLGWSKLTLRADQKVDRILCYHYPVKDVKASIAYEEEIEGRGEKERFQQINAEDVRQRYEAIEKYRS